MKPTRCTNFSNLFLEKNSTYFGQVFCPSSGVQYCLHSDRYMSYSTRLLIIDRKTYPKHIEFFSKNKFEKLVHFFGFIVRLYHDARSSECQILNPLLIKQTEIKSLRPENGCISCLYRNSQHAKIEGNTINKGINLYQTITSKTGNQISSPIQKFFLNT